MSDAQTFHLIAALSECGTRARAADELARHLGVEELLLFLTDPELGSLVPAPGFAQTLHGGAAWREFLSECSKGADVVGEVDLPADSRRAAHAVVSGDIVAVTLGGAPGTAELARLRSQLPLLGQMLKCEHRIALSVAEAADARESASQAHALSAALEGARAEQARLNMELRDEHRRKDEFLAMLAHELRNPLSPLLTSLEILRHPGVGPDVRERQLDVMARQVAQLSRLVEDLLDVSRVSHGRIELQRQPISLTSVIDAALEACAPLLQARRHRVSVTLPDPPVTVEGDVVRLTQVFANLVNNGAKYTEPGGMIRLSVEQHAHEAVVRIEDNGIGIDPRVLPRIFDLFAQGPVSSERAQGGLGIGLTLVRMLLELHGGSVSAHSRGLGHGSSFVVRLPLAAAAAHTTPAGVTPAAASIAGRALRVLVVDDNRDAADSLASILGLSGHHAEVAYAGVKAIQLATDLDPDLVLLDIGLPGMDGYEVARRLRRLGTRATRLVALTGYGSDDDMRRTAEAGFDEHVIKPVDPQTLAGILERTARGGRAGDTGVGSAEQQQQRLPGSPDATVAGSRSTQGRREKLN